MLRINYFARMNEVRKVKPKGSPLQVKRVDGMWKLVAKNPDLEHERNK